MRSLRDAFKDYSGYEIEWDSNVDNVIFSQASRHIIVHNAGKIDKKFLNQIKVSKNRTIKSDLNSDSNFLQFSNDEVKEIMNQIRIFFNRYYDQMISWKI